MKRNWTMLGSSLVALVAMAMTCPGQDRKNTDGQPAGPATAQQVEEITRSLNEMRVTMKQLTDRLDANMAMTQKDVNELKDQLARTLRDLDTMRGRATENRAFYSGPADTGRVRLLNTYFMPVDVVVNGMVYQLMPGQERYTGSLPAGTFTYEVVGVQAPRQRALAAGQTFTVDIYPQ